MAFSILDIDSQVEMFFAIDASNDVSHQSVEKMKQFVSALGRIYSLSSDKIRISLFSYGQQADKLLPLDEGISTMALRLALNKVKQQRGQRQVVNLLKAVKEIIINKRDGSRDDARKLLIVFIAGRDLTSNRAELVRESHELRRLGLGLILIGIGPNVKENDVRALGMSNKSFLYSETDDGILDKMTNISSIVGTREKKVDQSDLVFVIGNNRAGDNRQFELGKNIIREIVKRVNVSPEAIRIGLVAYGSDARVALPLDGSKGRGDVIRTVTGLSLPREGNGLSKALDLARTHLMAERQGRRKGVPQTVVVLLTGDTSAQSLVASAKLMEDGVRVKGVSLSRSISLESVARISSTPKDALKVYAESGVPEIAGLIVGSLQPGLYLLYTLKYYVDLRVNRIFCVDFQIASRFYIAFSCLHFLRWMQFNSRPCF